MHLQLRLLVLMVLLFIYANGDYTYTPNADSAGLGQVDQFTYTLLDPASNITSQATFYVHLDSKLWI